MNVGHLKMAAMCGHLRTLQTPARNYAVCVVRTTLWIDHVSSWAKHAQFIAVFITAFWVKLFCWLMCRCSVFISCLQWIGVLNQSLIRHKLRHKPGTGEQNVFEYHQEQLFLFDGCPQTFYCGYSHAAVTPAWSFMDGYTCVKGRREGRTLTPNGSEAISVPIHSGAHRTLIVLSAGSHQIIHLCLHPPGIINQSFHNLRHWPHSHTSRYHPGLEFAAVS